MTIPAAATLQLANTELGRASTFAFDMNADTAVRALALVSTTPGVPWSISSLAGKQAFHPVITVAIDGPGPNYGYGPTFGGISANNVFGVTVFGIWGGGSGNLSVNLNANVAQNFWTRLMFRTSVNAAPFWITDSANATSFFPGAITQWNFGSGFLMPALNGQSPIISFMR